MGPRAWAGDRRGQSLVEYLVIAAVVIMAILGARFLFQGQVKDLQTASQETVQKATAAVKSGVTAQKR